MNMGVFVSGMLIRGSLKQLVIALSVAACASRSGSSTNASHDLSHAQSTRLAELIAADRSAVSEAQSRKFTEHFATLFAPGGVYLTPTVTLARGPNAVKEWLLRDTLNLTSRATWRALRYEVSRDGRDGYSFGYFDVIHAAGDTAYGAFKAYWRRSDAGRWEMLAFARSRSSNRRIAAEPAWVGPLLLRSGVHTAPVDTISAYREIIASESAFSDSAAKHVGAAFASFAAPYGSHITPEGFGFGAAEIRAQFPAAATPREGPAWTPESGSVAASGDLGFTFGPAWPRSAPGPVPGGGRYFTVWKRQPDGRWRYVVD
jgi:hypothetical protein